MYSLPGRKDTALTEDRQPLPATPLATPGKSFLAGACLLMVSLTGLMTYPQVLHMRDGVDDAGDPLLNAWALSWVAHQLPLAPTRLFDGNIFHPEANTLAFSETLLAPALVVAPLRWLGVGAISVYNLVFLSGFALSGLGTVLLVYALTGQRGAAVVAGIIFAFLPYRMDHYAHLQLQQTQFIPLTLWALHRLVESGRRRDGVLLGACVAGQLLSCTYYGIFMIPYLALMAVALLLNGRLSKTRAQDVVDLHLQLDVRGWRRRLVALAAGVAVCLVIAAPTGRAYLAARALVGERGTEEVTNGSATWRNYLATSEANVLYGRWSRPYGDPERRLFAGVLPVLLALVALWPPLTRVRVAYALGLLFALDMSLGFNGFSYRFFYENLLPFRALRIPARMGLIVGFSLAVLAGHGVARVSGRLNPGRRALLAAVCSCLILYEYRSKPWDLTFVPTKAPVIYASLPSLAKDASSAVVELPIAQEDPTYMYYSTFHWRPLLNGYSGFFPKSYGQVVEALKVFPSEGGFEALRSSGTRYLLVHGELMNWGRYRTLIAALDGRQDVALVARQPWEKSEISLYELKR